MFHLPELVEQVVLLFDGEEPEKESSLVACTQVSRAWRQAFIHLYWRHINDAVSSRLGRTFKSLWFKRMSGYSDPQSREESLERRACLGKYLHYVRHLRLSFPWTLDLFLEWSITHQQPTELLVLTLDIGKRVHRCFSQSNQSLMTGSKAGIFSPDRESHPGEEDMEFPDASSLYDGSLSPQEQEALLSRVPRWTLRAPRYTVSRFPEQERFGRGLWQLIQSSPKLTRLGIEPYKEGFMSNPDLGGDANGAGSGLHAMEPFKQSAGALFLALVLKSHKNLTHFEPNLSMQEESVLEVMAQEQRRGSSSIQSYSTLFCHFDLPSDRAAWSLVRGRLLNTGMRRLTMDGPHIKSSRVRFFLEIFPNLEELHLVSVIRDQVTEDMETLVNTSLQKLSIRCKAFGLAACRVRFEGLKEFEALHMGREIWDLVTILRWSMPQCEVLHAGVSGAWRLTEAVQTSSIPSDVLALQRGVSSPEEMGLPIRELTLILEPSQTMPEILGAIRWMPFLTQVEFQGNWGTEVLEMLARHSLRLQRLEVLGMRGLSSQALCRILRSCKDLKSIRGPDLILRAIDVIQSQPWVCSGMQEFSCKILGVPRLTASEETELSQSDIGLEEVILEELAERTKWELDVGGVVGSGKGEGAIEGDQEKDDPRLQRKKWIAQLCRRRKLLTFQQRSRVIQHQIFSVLAKWTELEVLDLRRSPSDYKRIRIYRRRPYGLEWNFDSGVKQLATLKKLEVTYLDKFEHRAGEEERQWLRDNLPHLKAGSFVNRP